MGVRRRGIHWRSTTIEALLATAALLVLGVSLVVALLVHEPVAMLRFDPARIAAYGFIAVVAMMWLVLAIRLVGTGSGRDYLGAETDLNLGLYSAGRSESLTIAGLVVAALTLGDPGTDAASLLTVALVSFTASFITSSWVGRQSSEFIASAVHWIGLAALLSGVALLPATWTLVGRMVLVIGGASIAAYSVIDLRSRHANAFPRADNGEGRPAAEAPYRGVDV